MNVPVMETAFAEWTKTLDPQEFPPEVVRKMRFVWFASGFYLVNFCAELQKMSTEKEFSEVMDQIEDEVREWQANEKRQMQ